MTSIIEESKKAKGGGIIGKFNKRNIIILSAIIIVAIGSWFLFSKEKNTGKTAVQTKEWTVIKDDIVISVESDGKVVAKDGVELSFSVSGDNLEVDEVFVKEGNKVVKGDKIASVKTETLEFNVRTAYSSYQSSLADYNEAMRGSSDEEKQDIQDAITSAELSLSQAKISLANVIQSSENSVYDAERAVKTAKDNLDDNKNVYSSEDVSDAYEALVDTIKSTNISLESILKDSDEILGVDNTSINDDFENNLGAKESNSLSASVNSYKKAKSDGQLLNTYALNLNINSDYKDIDEATAQAVITLQDYEKHLSDIKIMLDATVTSVSLSQTALDALISTINSNRTSVNTKITALNTKIEAVEDAKDELDDYITDYNDALRDLENTKIEAVRDVENSEANVASKELSLEQKNRDYVELEAPLTDAELASERSRLTSASVSLERAQLELNKSILVSPIDGEIVQIKYAAGDIITDNDEPVATVINNDTLFIEVNIEEADISKLEVGQKAYATFDSLDELTLEGEISFISLISETSNNGIVTYLVRVIFEKQENQIREGMTAYIDFVAQEAKNILVIPVSAVRNVEGKPSVQMSTGEWQVVTTGFTDGKNVEVISGLNSGDKIIY